MRYVIIRDDDTNALTPVECLERLYRPFPGPGVARKPRDHPRRGDRHPYGRWEAGRLSAQAQRAAAPDPADW